MITLIFNFTFWGFFAHQKINRLAVFTLPSEMIRFYKNNITFIEGHAVDPDKRRYADTAEAPKHFIDADRYGSAPFDSIPQRWKDAVEKYGENVLNENGIVPWQIERTYYSLIKAFQARDSLRILKISADLGHYISDAHVPLHTTENYNGQLTGQIGIHGFWESRLPELFHNEYDFLVGRAQYISNPLKEAWAIVKKAQTHKDSVLLIEADLSRNYPSDKKYTYSQRNGRIERQYSETYARAYHERMNGMVEAQMRSSIIKTGSFWYSAWVDAGQPDLRDLLKIEPDTKEKLKEENEQQSFAKGKIIGRTEN
ncbi:MAG: zinc dependent phospholipase C family protein [Daejeonella sp.]|uniref:zinc dependent phospholipase C family protein n=1 Tax=Daejeonella sp. TaxID=2805397 RepID=UPI003C7946F1